MSSARPVQWHMPVQVRLGAGCLDELDAALGDSPAVVLVFAQAVRLGLASRLRLLLGARLVELVECADGLSSFAQARVLAPALWRALDGRDDAVLIAVGGGTVLDLAKLLRCRPANAEIESLIDAVTGRRPWPPLRIARLWLVPTTAGTGSEVTRWATLWDTDARPAIKRSLDTPFGFAERAFIDPVLARSCPAGVMRAAALDALAHALEAMWNRSAHAVSNTLALRAAQRVVAALPLALADRFSEAARDELSVAALEAGLAFAQTRTALAHALSYALTIELGVPHGLACAVWLPRVWQLAHGRDQALDERLGRVFGQGVDPQARALNRWLAAVGVDPDLTRLGIRDGDRRIAEALSSERGRNFVGAPA